MRCNSCGERFELNVAEMAQITSRSCPGCAQKYSYTTEWDRFELLPSRARFAVICAAALTAVVPLACSTLFFFYAPQVSDPVHGGAFISGIVVIGLFLSFIGGLAAFLVSCAIATKVYKVKLPPSALFSIEIGGLLSLAKAKVCNDHGIVADGYAVRTVADGLKCPACDKYIVETTLLLRLQIERIVFVGLLAIIMLIALCNSAGTPNGGVVVPWAVGATLWNLTAAVIAFIVVGYVGITFLQYPLWRLQLDLDKLSDSDLKSLSRFSWRRFVYEGAYSVAIGAAGFAGWFVYWFVMTEGKAFR